MVENIKSIYTFNKKKKQALAYATKYAGKDSKIIKSEKVSGGYKIDYITRIKKKR